MSCLIFFLSSTVVTKSIVHVRYNVRNSYSDRSYFISQTSHLWKSGSSVTYVDSGFTTAAGPVTPTLMCATFVCSSTFIVWLLQMSLQLVMPSKLIWAVSTQVWLYVNVNTSMTLQFFTSLRKDNDMVFCCCVHNACVHASSRTGWNLCYEWNTGVACLPYGLSRGFSCNTLVPD